MQSLIRLQEKLAVAGNPMFRKATQLRRQLRAEQRQHEVSEAWSLPGGITLDRVAARSQILALEPGVRKVFA
jgi:hypothetical protein